MFYVFNFSYQHFIISNTFPNVSNTLLLTVVDGEIWREATDVVQEVRKHLFAVDR